MRQIGALLQSHHRAHYNQIDSLINVLLNKKKNFAKYK